MLIRKKAVHKSLILGLVMALFMSLVETVALPSPRAWAAEDTAVNLSAPYQEFRLAEPSGLNIRAAGVNNNASIQVGPTGNQPEERWRLNSADGVNYKLFNMAANKLLSPKDGNLSNEIVLYDDTSAETQLWNFILTDPLNEEGYVHYKIVNKTDRSKALTLDQASGTIRIANYQGLESQKWKLVSDGTPAFPGAEGGGKYTTGGRFGEVYEVTTLADSGPGSLREGIAQSNKTIVFRVGGTIHLNSGLRITGSILTIAVQAAPGEGISVADHPSYFEADNLINRHMRFRLGDRYPSEEDAFGGRYRKNIIVDHCSFSWSVDEVLSMYVNENTTAQWSIASESMLMTSHQKGRHGYAGIWGGNNATFHHNLIAHNVSRNPRFASSPNFPTDMYNNIVYDWGFFSAYGGEEGRYNLRNNYFKPGPSTYGSVRDQLFLDVAANTRIYIGGNYMYGSEEVTEDNWKGVKTLASPESKLTSPVIMPQPVTPEPAMVAYENVLANSGATLPRRDAIDSRIVQEVKDGRGRHINSQKEVGGYLEFAHTVSTLADDDHDGMPNDWEIANGLNSNDAADRNAVQANGYTNLEIFLNSITGNGSMNPVTVITAPADYSVVEEGTNLEITAAATDPDGTVAKVEFYAGDMKLGEDITAPYSYTWENVRDGSYFLTVRAIDNTGTATQSSNVALHVNKPGSIAPWQAADIGSPGVPGHTQFGASPSDVTVKSAGDIGNRSDNFHFAYQELTGNGEIIARVESITGTDDEAQAGIMLRESLDASAKFIGLFVSYVKYGKKSIVFSRANQGDNVAKVEPEAFINTPHWVKLARLGDTVTSLVSSNGTDWTVVDTAVFPMSETVYVGLAADAAKVDDEVNKYNTSVFSQVALNPLDKDFPTAPQGLMAMAGDKEIVLSWNDIPLAESYNVFRSVIPGGPYKQVATGIAEPTFTDQHLIPGMTYFYIVTAVNEKGTSFNSLEVSATAEGEPETVYYVDDDFEDDAVGTTPADYTYAPNPADADHKVVVTDIPAGTTGNPSSKALILYDNGVGSTDLFRKFTPQTGKFVLEVDLTSQGWPGTSTVLNLQDDAGSKTALSFQLRRPSAPVPESAYTLIYKKNGTDYKLMNPPVNNQWYRLKIVANVVSRTADIYIDNVLVENDAPLENDMRTIGIGRITARTPGTGKGTLYYDNLKVYVEPVESPNGLAAVPGNGMVQLDWTAADGATTYNIKRSTTDGGPYTVIATGVTDVSYIDQSVENETKYYYVVTAVGTTGQSGPSNQVEVTPSTSAVKPAAPTGLAATATSAQVNLSWEPVENALTYTVKRGTSPQGPFTKVASDLAATTYRDGKLDNGTNYYYIVSATGIGGEGTDSTVIAALPYSHLSTPVLSAEPVANGALLKWENVAGATAYRVERAVAPEGPYTVVSERIMGISYEDYGLNNGIPYYYKITAVNGQTHSLNSSAAGIRPSANDGTPASPSNLIANPGDGTIVLSWDEAARASSYTVRRSTSAAGPFTIVAKGLVDTTFTDTTLTNGTTYYYLVAASNSSGAGASSVTVRETPATTLTVAADGSGQYTKIQDAINAVPNNSVVPTIIKIKNGSYREKIDVPSSKLKLRLIGESREHTILVNGDAASTLDAHGNAMGTSGSYSFRIQANDFTAEHLTISNDAGINAGQAVALYASAERLVLRDVSLLGYQDTLYANGGRQYYADCFIAGTVDFIFGGATAVFENSILHSFGGGYVTAASTGPANTGYVFLNSRLTAEQGVTGVQLGRPWRGDANVIYINSYMGAHISPEGWSNWGNVNNEKTARYGEFASYGPGANSKNRHSWAKQLTAEEAAQYATAFVLEGNDGWNPASAVPLADGNSQLASLTVKGSLLPDFSPAKLNYQAELTDMGELPIVTATALSAASTVTVEQATAASGTATVRVNAQDGSETVYTVEFRGPGVHLTGPTAVPTSYAFDLTYGLANVTSNVYAKSLTVHYDPTAVEYLGVMSLLPEFTVVGSTYSPGQVRILEAATSQTKPVTGTVSLLKIQFRSLDSTVTTRVYTSDIVIADQFGYEVALTTNTDLIITISEVRKQELAALLTQARSAHTAAKVLVPDAPRWGYYPQAAIAALSNAISVAESVLNQPDAMQSQVAGAIAALRAELEAFKSTASQKAGVGDLAIIAANYEVTNTSANWEKLRILDMNNDGILDIADLVSIAVRVLN